MREQGPRTVEAAIAEEWRFGGAARRSLGVRRGERVAGPRQFDAHAISLCPECLVIRLERIGHFRVHVRVGSAVEQPDAIALEAGDVVDAAVPGELPRLLDQLRDGNLRLAFHAAAERLAHRSLGAAVGARSEEASTPHEARVRDVELRGHGAA